MGARRNTEITSSHLPVCVDEKRCTDMLSESADISVKGRPRRQKRKGWRRERGDGEERKEGGREQGREGRERKEK